MTYFTKMSHRIFPVFLTQRLRFILLSQGIVFPRIPKFEGFAQHRDVCETKGDQVARNNTIPKVDVFGNTIPLKMDLTFPYILEVGEVLHLDLAWGILFHCCHQEDQHGHTPLLWAVRHGMAGAMQLLLRRMQV